MKNITIPNDVKFIIETIETANYEAYIVGGCVRDILNNTPPKDWDVATSATPLQIKELFTRTVDTGIKHGTVTVLIEGRGHEVTTYRVDGEYNDSRRPDTVTFTKSIEEDLSRRDFTMNAIAYNPRCGFVDPFGGTIDISKKLIRCVGLPSHRFSEDALRMLRAIRFSGVLGFNVHEDILDAISKHRKTIKNISVERIQQELRKLLMGSYPKAIDMLDSTGLLQYILPDYHYIREPLISWLKECPKKESLRWVLFLSSGSDEHEKILKHLRFDNKTIQEVLLYGRFMHIPIGIITTRYEIKKTFLRHMSQECFENLIILKSIISENKTPNLQLIKFKQEADDIFQKDECYTINNLAINGDDLLKMGIPRGKAIGETLEYLLDKVMQDPTINTCETLLNITQCIKQPS